MDLNLTGRVAVVTGASKGIGLAATRILLEEGAQVVATSRRTSAELDALAGKHLVHVPADLMDPETHPHTSSPERRIRSVASTSW